ncbi:hypothetical protein [Halorussus salinisoli]|uniref:hypothetical protein n=1 Tax=Halorussus salinisoli TaxID=2558242 RepID=UPI0010C20E71|nr:hypothetical protein [Halorussus salinisoli]
MSNAPSPLNERTTRLPDDTRSELRDGVESALETLTAPFRFAGFWSAVVLPVVYLPMLAGGITADERSVFAVLLAAHVLALVVGHGYRSN